MSVTARATDGVGNTGAASEEIVAKDTVAPLARDLVATQASTASPTTTVTGTRSEASAVTVTVTDGTTEASAEVPSGEGAFEADVDVASMEPGTLDVLVEVEDAVGNTSASATVTEVRITTTAVLDALPRRVTFGETVVVSGAIEVPEGAPRPSEQVDLVEVRDGTDLVVAPVPLEDGRFAVELTPTGTATYAIRYAGGSLHTASRSNEETVRVAWALRAKAPSTSQQRVRVSGRVDPARAGTRVVVHELVKGEGARSLGRTTTRRNGRFVIRVAVPEGRSRLRVKVPGAQDLAVARVKLTTRRR